MCCIRFGTFVIFDTFEIFLRIVQIEPRVITFEYIFSFSVFSEFYPNILILILYKDSWRDRECFLFFFFFLCSTFCYYKRRNTKDALKFKINSLIFTRWALSALPPVTGETTRLNHQDESCVKLRKLRKKLLIIMWHNTYGYQNYTKADATGYIDWQMNRNRISSRFLLYRNIKYCFVSK